MLASPIMEAPTAPKKTASSDVASRDSVRVLFVEDDEKLGRLTAEYLSSHGLAVTLCRNGSEALAAFRASAPDVVLLDVMLPGQSGLEVCRLLRQKSDVPIVMVTARDEEADRVLGLELGADDYVVKPFSARELLARIHAHTRRARGLLKAQDDAIEVGALRIEPAALKATLSGAALDLTTYEFSLLRVLAERAGRVLTREQLLEEVRGDAHEALDRTVDVHISRLRQKLGDNPRRPRWLKTVRGSGYMLAREAE